MTTAFTVHHNEHVSSRSFEEVVSAFESAVDPWKTLDSSATSLNEKCRGV